MNVSQWMSIGVGILLVGFIVFAFRQGLQVKPNKEARDDYWRFLGRPPDPPPSS